MMKRLMLMMMLFISIVGAKAQEVHELPLNPNVLHGTLPNGLNYYILHNEEPKNRANFYIAQKVGSTLETPEQLGLAHFLEHMAFNGTKHFPGKNMLNYLEHKGIRFGADINAYTSFDETVYNINNVPTNDQALMDSVLLVLYDWSGSILLEEDEINAERGVIQGEYTMRNDANTRMLEAILPALYEEYQYSQTPIGSMEVVKNFPPQALRDYYKKWYRPDLQGIVIVGDFDAAAMEAKVKALFADIPMPENAAERTYPAISDNVNPIYVTFEDPELQMPRIDTYFKSERFPKELRNTDVGYLFDHVINNMVAMMINNRLNEYAQKPDCPYSYAMVNIGQFMFSDQKGSFTVIIIPKDNYETAYSAAMGIVVRACKTGFMGTEVQRVRDELLANAQAMYNEKDKTNSETLANELITHFIKNTPAPGIENEYKFLSENLPMIPEMMFNQFASSLIHYENSAIVVTQPSSMGLDLPAEKDMLTQLSNIIDADYEPYVDEVITEPLISKLPKPGKIVSETSNSDFEIKEYKLSNGVKVVVKPTDFANDEVLLEMFKPGGYSSYPSSEAADVQGMEFVLEVSKIGPFNPTRLGKYLAGKKVSLNYNIGNSNNYFTGSSTVKDVEDLFQMLYAAFTDVTADQETYEATISQLKAMLVNQQSSPDYIFQLKRMEALYPNSPALYPLSASTLEKMDYSRMLKLYSESLKNAAEFTLILTGNIDEKTIKPILEQYVATLPASKVKSGVPVNITSIVPVAGKKHEVFDISAQNPSVYVFNCVSQKGLEYNVANDVNIDLLGDVLYMIFLETLREEMGGTYSPYATASLNPYTSTWTLSWYVVTNEEMQQAIVDRANLEFKNLLAEGTDMQHFAKVREAAVKQLENNSRSNNYWLKTLLLKERGYDSVTGRKAYLESLTLDEFNNFIKNVYNGENQIELIGVAK